MLTVCGAVLVSILLTSPVGAESDGCSPVEFGRFDIAPAMLDSVPPNVERAWEINFSDSIWVDVYVREDGTVCDARPNGGPVNSLIPAVVAAAARQSRYAPALRDGRAVPGVLRVTYTFEPPDLRPQPPLVDTASPMVSERAEIVGQADVAFAGSFATECEVGVPVFDYNGVAIYGDLSVRDYETLCGLVADRLDELHFVGRIHHYLVLAEDCRSSRPLYGGQHPDVGVQIFRRSDTPTEIGSPRVTYYFLNVGGEYRELPLYSGYAPEPSATESVE